MLSKIHSDGISALSELVMGITELPHMALFFFKNHSKDCLLFPFFPPTLGFGMSGGWLNSPVNTESSLMQYQYYGAESISELLHRDCFIFSYLSAFVKFLLAYYSFYLFI